MIEVHVFTTPSLKKEIPKVPAGCVPEIESEGWVTVESDDPEEIERIKALFPENKEVKLVVSARYPDACGKVGEKTHTVWHRKGGVGFGEAI